MRRCTILITKKVYSSVNYLQRDPWRHSNNKSNNRS
jgi:hypothetical protein